MPIRWVVKPGAYHDSVSLMQISSKISSTPGVRSAAAVMATPMNMETLAADGLLVDDLRSAGPNDLVLVVDAADEAAAEAALKQAEALLTAQPQRGGDTAAGPRAPRTVEEATKVLSGANLALISVPGTYAAYEAGQCLRRGLHVHLFSDNVSVEDELALKRYAKEHGLLVMGPDCGTAIINGTPLGFANVVRRGPVGVVGASGTGTQAVTVLVDRMGSGISHAIGTGGRDLSDAVGGIMFLAGIDALEADDQTRVIVLISKPPGEKTMEKVLARVETCSKPVVTCLLRGGQVRSRNPHVHTVGNLEEAARKAVSLATGQDVPRLETDNATRQAAASAVTRFAPDQRYLRGLYSGGTLCDEAMVILRERGLSTWSNVPIESNYRLESGRISREHTVVDLGEDEFTRGRPHPMIDPSLRNQRIVQEFSDPAVAVLIVDVVLGYGSHIDPAGAVADAVRAGRAARPKGAGEVCVIASVCGTEADPQNLPRQEATLREAGVLVFPSNAAAATAAADMLLQLQRRV